jgi:hypothetical protein
MQRIVDIYTHQATDQIPSVSKLKGFMAFLRSNISFGIFWKLLKLPTGLYNYRRVTKTINPSPMF